MSSTTLLAAASMAQLRDNPVDDAAGSIGNFFANLGWPEWLTSTLTVISIVVIGLIIAWILRAVVSKIINSTPFGRRAQTSGGNIGKAIGSAVFWLTLLYAVFIAFSVPGIEALDGALEPVGELIASVIAFIPRLLVAGFILFIGYIIAAVARNATTATLDAAGVDNFANRTGVASATGSRGSLSNALGLIVFVLILVPVIIEALGQLQLGTISESLSGMLATFADFIPNVVGAAIVLAVALFIGRFIKGFVESILPTFGFDHSLNQVMMIDDGEATTMQPSKIVGTIAYLVVAVLGIAAAINILGIESLDNAFTAFLALGGRVLTAAVTIIAGVFLANFVERIISGATGSAMGRFLKYAIVFLVSFMALSQIGIGDEIVETLFASLAIGASVAFAIAFGVGGTGWAKDMLGNLAPPKATAQKLQSSTSRTATAVRTAAAKTRAKPKAATKAAAATRTAKPRVTPKKK